MALYRCSEEKESYQRPEKYDWESFRKPEKHEDCDCDKHDDHDKHDDCEKHDDCDRESAKALKCILSQIDDLNNRDLRILDDVIDRLLCIRKKL